MVTFEDILKANEGMTTVPIKGKDYVVVPQRVKAFRKLYPEGFILTDIVSHTDGMVVMQAKVGFYNNAGEPVVIGSGLAFEKQESSFINKTSYIENCETSAIGRALGFLGLGIDTQICSAEELINAISNQDESDVHVRAKNEAHLASVTKVDKVPEPVPQRPAQAEKPAQVTPGSYLQARISEMKAKYPNFNFISARKGLIEGGVVPDVPSATMTMEQAVQLAAAVEDIYAGEVG